jgi:Zn-finger nucleic acid-binding protein
MRLGQRSLHEVTIDECPAGHGLWLDQGELEAASQRRGAQWVRQFLQGLTQFIAHPLGELPHPHEKPTRKNY